MLREPQQTQRYAQLALQISNEKGYPYTRILSAVLLGWSLAMQGQMAEGIALARQGLNAANETSLRLHYSQLSAMLAEILMAAGRHEEAIEVLDEGIRRFEQYRDLLCAADLWTLKGDALLALNTGYDAVEECYQTALALARRLGAQVSALRAATRLAQLSATAVGTQKQVARRCRKSTCLAFRKATTRLTCASHASCWSNRSDVRSMVSPGQFEFLCLIFSRPPLFMKNAARTPNLVVCTYDWTWLANYITDTLRRLAQHNGRSAQDQICVFIKSLFLCSPCCALRTTADRLRWRQTRSLLRRRACA